MDLDNREIAFLAWFFLLACVFLWPTRRSKPLHSLIQILLSRPILFMLGAVVCYVAMCVWLLSVPGWWQWSNLKTTLLWTGGFALAAVFNYKNVENGKAFLMASALEVLGINAILSFISSSHTFSLPTELVIVGAIILLAALSAISEHDAKLKPINKLATVLLIALSVMMLTNSAYRIAIGFGDFATSHTAREFGVPVLLTLMFLPFLYGVYALITYQYVFHSFDFSVKDPILRRHVM